jgi:hypothetical protein
MSELTLKWGTIKGYNFVGSEKAKQLLTEYNTLGESMSCMMQHDNQRQREIILELIDLCDDPEGIYLDWDGKYVSKDDAKKYIIDYGKEEKKKGGK